MKTFGLFSLQKVQLSFPPVCVILKPTRNFCGNDIKIRFVPAYPPICYVKKFLIMPDPLIDYSRLSPLFTSHQPWYQRGTRCYASAMTQTFFKPLYPCNELNHGSTSFRLPPFSFHFRPLGSVPSHFFTRFSVLANYTVYHYSHVHRLFCHGLRHGVSVVVTTGDRSTTWKPSLLFLTMPFIRRCSSF